MLPIKLLSLIALVGGAISVPLHSLSKRALPRLGGLNIAGCEFGMDTNGGSGTYYCPSTDQITHFVDKGANLVRLPVGWQYLTGNNQASTSLDSGYLSKVDGLIQASLKAGAYVMIDVHNYARWNGGIVGQGGPTNDQFAKLWSLLAAKYKNEPKIIFGIMNEPHDVPDNAKWATTVQAAVNAIREAGATSQTIAIPGNFWAHADDWLNGNNAPLLNVKDPATNDNSLLILDVHKYLDGDGSGTSRECVTNGIDTWTKLQSFLKTNGRKAIISEIGGGNTASCATNLEQSLAFIAQNTNEYVGFAAWSAGSFDANYELSLTPVNGQDNNLFVKAVQPHLLGKGSSTQPAPSSSSARSSVSSKPATSSRSATSSSTSTSRAATTSKASSTSKAVSSTSKAATTTTKATTTTTKAPTTTSVSGNLQKYTGSIGGISAPAVTKSGSTYVSAGRTFNFVNDALGASCYAQMDSCQKVANSSGNKGDVTVEKCNGQECLKVASA